MSGRIGSLNNLGSWLALVFLVGAPSVVRAHRLDAQAFFVPDQKQIRVEAWFDNGTPARNAKVQVFSDDRLVNQGETDNDARFVFAVTEIQPLRVVVTASGGHRKELDISAEDFRHSLIADPSGPSETNVPPTTPSPAVPLTEARSENRLKDLVLGISFLLALAAFVMSLRTARQLRANKYSKRGDL